MREREREMGGGERKKEREREISDWPLRDIFNIIPSFSSLDDYKLISLIDREDR